MAWSRAPPSTTASTRPIVVREGERRHRSGCRRTPTAVSTVSGARAAHSAISSVLLAPDTAAQAQTRRIAVSEYQRPRLARGSGTRSRKGRRSAT